MDLGVKEKPYDAPSPASPADKKPRISFPSFDVREEHADECRKEYGCEVDKEGTATIRFRISGDTKDQYSNRVTFEVLSLDDVKLEGEASEDDEEKKVLGYKRPNKNEEAPDTKEADNVEDY